MQIEHGVFFLPLCLVFAFAFQSCVSILRFRLALYQSAWFAIGFVYVL
nr:MAG TPA: hypothetical protein [Caudoviricetes sp.]